MLSLLRSVQVWSLNQSIMEAMPCLPNPGQRHPCSFPDHRREEVSKGATFTPRIILSTETMRNALLIHFILETKSLKYTKSWQHRCETYDSQREKKNSLTLIFNYMEQTETNRNGKEDISTFPIIAGKTSTLPCLHPRTQENHLCTHREKDHPGSKWLTWWHMLYILNWSTQVRQWAH